MVSEISPVDCPLDGPVGSPVSNTALFVFAWASAAFFGGLLCLSCLSCAGGSEDGDEWQQTGGAGGKDSAQEKGGSGGEDDDDDPDEDDEDGGVGGKAGKGGSGGKGGAGGDASVDEPPEGGVMCGEDFCPGWSCEFAGPVSISTQFPSCCLPGGGCGINNADGGFVCASQEDLKNVMTCVPSD
ncbi:MAG: hypothetical protein FWD57_04060 [Polyangiaceae bacterium]|nr:hypothetical protein [Polyangiaceae bacterium]